MSIAQNTRYISFCGTFNVPDNIEELNTLYPEIIYDSGEEAYADGFRRGIKYGLIDGRDSADVYLSKIDKNVGHLVLIIQDQREETFVCLNSEGWPQKSDDNVNVNPISQLCDFFD